MEIETLSLGNPWWLSKSVPPELKGEKRKEYDLLIKSADIREVTIITGVRRSGKSTFMYQIIEHLLEEGISPEQILFVNLEDDRLTNNTLEDIYNAYRSAINQDKKAYIFLDEVHKKEKWEQWVRKHYDLHTNCKFIVSGSCSYLLKKEYSTLLTGRNITFEVYPLSFHEFIGFKGIDIDLSKMSIGIISEKDKYLAINALAEYILHGGFPRIFFQKPEFKDELLRQYFDDILSKDIIDRHKVDSQKVRDLARYAMTNITGIMSLRNVRNAIGLAYESIKEYLSFYKDAYLLFTLDHFSYSMKEQKTHASKVYCIDTGLRNIVAFKFSADEGKLAENLVFVELMRRKKEVYYWKSVKENEVDFVIKNKDNTLSAINITYGNVIPEREVIGLEAFKSKYKRTKNLIVLTKNIEKKEKNIQFIPLWKWLLSSKA